MREGEVLIITNGAMTQRALTAAELLSLKGIECGVLHVHTVKPLDQDIAKHVQRARMVVIIEEHTLVGGLSSACMELLVDTLGCVNVPPIHRFGLPDQFVQEYGDQDSLLERFGLQPAKLAQRIAALVKHPLSSEMVKA